MWFDGIRQPNTLYVANTSRGKDSTAMLRAIQLMGWPLDMICSVDIWFDQDTPAELPEMVKFKDEYDAKVLEMFGVPVTRLCATKRERERRTADCSTPPRSPKSTGGTSKDFQIQTTHGANCLKTHSMDDISSPQKLTYCDIFYRKIPPQRERERERERESCNSATDGTSLTESTASRLSKESGVSQPSNDRHSRIPESAMPLVYRGTQESGHAYGFPISSNRGGTVVYRPQGRTAIKGFPWQKGAWCQDRLKAAPLDKPRVNEGQKINIVHYIGIAADEPLRIKKHIGKKDKVLPLVQIGWDEALCGLEAQYMDMLSPTYETGERDGCWFCHNQGIRQLRKLRHNYPDLWAKLMRLDLDSPVTFRPDGHTVHDFDRRFAAEDAGLIDPSKPFRWKMLDGDLQMSLF